MSSLISLDDVYIKINGGIMNAQHDILYRFEAHLALNPVGITAEGLRMANTFDGRVTGGALMDGPLAGARVWGVDHFILRRDGVGIVDAQKTLSAGDVHLVEHVRGYATPPAGVELPPLEALLEPGFEWPDLHFPIHGFSQFRVAHPELDHLNRAHAEIQGWVNLSNGALAVETRIVEPREGVVIPDPEALAAVLTG